MPARPARPRWNGSATTSDATRRGLGACFPQSWLWRSVPARTRGRVDPALGAGRRFQLPREMVADASDAVGADFFENRGHAGVRLRLGISGRAWKSRHGQKQDRTRANWLHHQRLSSSSIFRWISFCSLADTSSLFRRLAKK